MSIWSSLTSAINAGNISGGLSALANLKSMIGVSDATKQQVAMLTLQFEMNQPQGGAAPTPAQSMAMTQVCQSLVALIPSLPAADGPLIQELGTPAIQANPATAAGIIGQIQQSLISSNPL